MLVLKTHLLYVVQSAVVGGGGILRFLFGPWKVLISAFFLSANSYNLLQDVALLSISLAPSVLRGSDVFVVPCRYE